MRNLLINAGEDLTAAAETDGSGLRSLSAQALRGLLAMCEIEEETADANLCNRDFYYAEKERPPEL
jgi:hypothetical protein